MVLPSVMRLSAIIAAILHRCRGEQFEEFVLIGERHRRRPTRWRERYESLHRHSRWRGACAPA